MPKKIDRIGRAHEWLTAYNIDGDVNSNQKAKSYLSVLSDTDRKRVTIGSYYTAKKIKELNSSKKIIKAEVVGEENKKPGSEDFDITLRFDDGGKIGYSLKIQGNSIGVNVRNPTINSICMVLTGKSFEECLSSMEKEDYIKKGKLYSEDKLESKVLGSWAAGVVRNIFKQSFEKNPKEFINRLMTQVRLKTNLILTLVDSDGKFVKQIVDFPDGIKQMNLHPEKVKIESHGISVFFSIDTECPIHLDIYMISDSSGKGTKLRAAMRVNF